MDDEKLFGVDGAGPFGGAGRRPVDAGLSVLAERGRIMSARDLGHALRWRNHRQRIVAIEAAKEAQRVLEQE